MKIFAVTADVELTRKPPWFDMFRARYDDPYALHITLKQPSVVEDGDVETLKRDVGDFFASWHSPEQPLRLPFDCLHVRVRTKEDICIMIDATGVSPLHALQAEIVGRIGTRFPYLKAEYRTYEEHFRPHITIARRLEEQNYGEAVRNWTADFMCEGRITSYSLILVPQFGPEEANKVENRTVYTL